MACLQVRLNFLSPLLAMSYQHLHNTLTASVISQKLFTMPFHRDVEVTHAGARAMLGALTYCHQVTQGVSKVMTRCASYYHTDWGCKHAEQHYTV